MAGTLKLGGLCPVRVVKDVVDLQPVLAHVRRLFFVEGELLEVEEDLLAFLSLNDVRAVAANK